MKILIVFGTRPEAIKVAPVIKAFQSHPKFDIRVCVTAQHRQMLDQVLELFDIKPDFDLDIMQQGQDLTSITTKVLAKLRDVFKEWKADWVMVQGDTTTCFTASLAAFYEKIPVAHIEAGLRTNDIYAPWPEEMNRRLTSAIASLHFAPTHEAKNNLIKESIHDDKIIVTGNTVIDSLWEVVKIIEDNPELQKKFTNTYSFLDFSLKLILVTGHRRENFGQGFEEICLALKALSQRDDVEIVYPVHLNPNVREPVNRILGNCHNIHLLGPLDYLPFVYLMNRCYFILTDSGGVQEEAPSLGKPVLVMRETTERPEAVEVGTVKLVGTDRNRIIQEAECLLSDPKAYEKMSQAHNPYGDGKAAERIINELCNRS